MTKLVLATNNEKKRREMVPLLSALDLELVLPRELGVAFDPEETGTTFIENARIKAQAALEATGLPALADDSGLEVMALDGAPGVWSARYGAPEAVSDTDRNQYLLKTMHAIERRSARFVCQLVCLLPDGRSLEARGVCEGEILNQPRGWEGFGYDPLFWLPSLGKTMAQLYLTEKNTLSHRALAIRKFIELWREKRCGIEG